MLPLSSRTTLRSRARRSDEIKPQEALARPAVFSYLCKKIIAV